MNNLSYSFKPDGSYFVFDLDTGATVAERDQYGRKMTKPRQARRAWIAMRGK